MTVILDKLYILLELYKLQNLWIYTGFQVNMAYDYLKKLPGTVAP